MTLEELQQIRDKYGDKVVKRTPFTIEDGVKLYLALEDAITRIHFLNISVDRFDSAVTDAITRLQNTGVRFPK
jgi:hypothetical protein